MAEPDAAVRDLIDAAHITGLTKDTRGEPPFNGNLVLGPPLGEDANAAGLGVFIIETGGSLDAPFVGGSKSHKVHAVQVYVRGPRNQYAATMTLAKAVRAALHYQTASGYYVCHCREACPIYIGRDDYERHGFSINVELRRTV